MKLNVKEFRKEVGLKLIKLREALGYDYYQMARYFGIGPSGYRKNEMGRSLPGPNSLFLLFSEHNISMNWLLFGKGPKNAADENTIRQLEEKVAAQQEELETCRRQLETATMQAEQSKKDLETMETETGTLRELTPDMREMVEQMLQNRTLKHQLLLQFSRFMDENRVSGLKTKTTRKSKSTRH